MRHRVGIRFVKTPRVPHARPVRNLHLDLYRENNRFFECLVALGVFMVLWELGAPGTLQGLGMIVGYLGGGLFKELLIRRRKRRRHGVHPFDDGVQ